MRLRNRVDFHRVYRYGKSVANHQFVLYQCRNKDISYFRVGISCSKKIGNAVVRNRIRRLIKEIVRHHQTDIVQQIDLIFMVRKSVLHMSYQQLEKSIVHVLRKANVVKDFKK